MTRKDDRYGKPTQETFDPNKGHGMASGGIRRAENRDWNEEWDAWILTKMGPKKKGTWGHR